MINDYESRFKSLEDKVDKLLAYKDDIKVIRKLLNFIKKNKKYLRFGIDIMLLISTILGFFVI